MTWRKFLMVYVAIQLLADSSHAEEKDPWIGGRVFVQYGMELRTGNTVVYREGQEEGVTNIYRVERVNGGWLWLKDEQSQNAGWVQTQFVVPYEQAIDYCTNLLRTVPSAYRYGIRGIAWHEKGEYEKAVADYSEAIRLEPGEASFWSSRGAAWEEKRDLDRAIADYDQAIRLNPGHNLAYNNRGNAFRKKGDFSLITTTISCGTTCLLP